MKKIKAPWTDDQVSRLEKRQRRTDLHPYTCPECGDVLKVFKNGFYCPGDCMYSQEWAWNRDLEEKP